MAEETEGKDDEALTDEGVGLELARTMLGELVLRAGYGNERIVLTRKGKQIAALIGLKDLDRLKTQDSAAA